MNDYRVAFFHPCQVPIGLSSSPQLLAKRLIDKIPQPGSISPPFGVFPKCVAPHMRMAEPSGQSRPPTVIKKTPVHRRIPYVGALIDLLLFGRTPTDFRNWYGPLYKSDFLGQWTTFVSDLDTVSEAMRNPNVFQSRDAFPPSVQNVFGADQLHNLDGAAHLAKRKLIERFFSPAIFRIHFQCVSRSCDLLWNGVALEVSANGTANLFQHIKDHFLRLAIETTAGNSVVLADFPRVSALFTAASAALISLPGTRGAREGFKAKWQLINMFKEIIKSTLTTRAGTIDGLRMERDDDADRLVRNAAGQKHLDLLTFMCGMSDLPTGREIADDDEGLCELAETVLFTWLAGPATESSVALSMILELGKDEEIRARLQEEQERLIAARGGDRTITFEMVSSEMPLLTSFLQETLRLHPPAAAIFRKVRADTVVLGHQLKAGTMVVLDVWGAQRDEKYYENAGVFVMDRFLVRDSQGRKAPAHVTFTAAGSPHKCIGSFFASMALKTSVATLLREFVFELDPSQNLEWRLLPEVRPKSGVDFIACRRRFSQEDEGF